MGNTMVRAAVCRAFGSPLTIEDIAVAAPGPGEVLVDVKACAICHSDISYINGEWGGDLPAVYGHEAAGIVVEAGAGAGFEPGDHVLVTLIRFCGQCHYCVGGSTVMCEEVFASDTPGPLTGADTKLLWRAMNCGAFAEQALVHSSQAVKLPDDIDFAEASLLACGVITGYGAVANTAKLKQGQSVAVIGCGGVGLNAVQGAAICGASTVIAMDLSESKMVAAKRFGATHTVNPAAPDVVQQVMALTENRGCDVVLVTVGAKRAIEDAPQFITRNGSIVIVGMPPSGVMAQYDPGTLAAWNQKILGSKMGETDLKRDIPRLLDAWHEGRLKLEELITDRYPLDRINEAIEAVVEGKALRNVIVFD